MNMDPQCRLQIHCEKMVAARMRLEIQAAWAAKNINSGSISEWAVLDRELKKLVSEIRDVLPF